MRRGRAVRTRARELASVVLIAAVASAIAMRRGPLQNGNGVQSEAAPSHAHITVDATAAATPQETPVAQTLFGENIPEPLPWEGWASLDGPVLPVTVEGAELRVAAARTAGGVTVAVVNPGAADARFQLAVRLGAGRYLVERLTVADGERASQWFQPIRGDAEKPGAKPGALPAGGTAVFSYINPIVRASAAYRSLSRLLNTPPASRTAASQRLRSALRECPWHLTRAERLLTQADSTPALDHVHRALLVTRHALALCSNSVGLGRMPAEQGRRAAELLTEMEDALGYASAAALDLVPGVRRSAEADGDGQTVTVSARNAGRLTVSGLRLWVTGPDGCRVEPVDAAVFDTLRPGQTATASFTVHGLDAASAGDLAGHVGYVRRNAPAHLRVPCP